MGDSEPLKDIQRLCGLQWTQDETGENFLALSTHFVSVIVRREGGGGRVVGVSGGNQQSYERRCSAYFHSTSWGPCMSSRSWSSVII